MGKKKYNSIMEAALFMDTEEYEELTCPHCNGSGEGMHDGTKCVYCKGSGVEE